jgi:capsid portal protein
MASSSSLLLTELNFLAPQFTPKRRRSNSGFCILPTRIRALKEEGALVEERVVSDVKWSGNGSVVNGSNGSVRGYVNGSGNGSLVKYVNGNGVAAEVVEDFVETSKRKEVGRKKRLEEIGKEDAWFKQNGEPQVEVCVYDCAMLFDLTLCNIDTLY